MGDDASTRGRRTLWVSGLDEAASAALVRAACVPFGDIRDVHVPLDNKTGRHRGFAFVEFELEADAKECVDNLHGAELMGRTLRVTVARPQREHGTAGKAVWSQEAWFKSLAEGGAEGAGGSGGAGGGGGGGGGRGGDGGAGGADDGDGDGDAILPPL